MYFSSTLASSAPPSLLLSGRGLSETHHRLRAINHSKLGRISSLPKVDTWQAPLCFAESPPESPIASAYKSAHRHATISWQQDNYCPENKKCKFLFPHCKGNQQTYSMMLINDFNLCPPTVYKIHVPPVTFLPVGSGPRQYLISLGVMWVIWATLKRWLLK